MSQYTFQFNDLAAYASAKASGGSIAAALSGVSSTDISRSVVSYIKGIGQAVTDSVNLFVPYAKGGLAGDVLYYTGTEYCWLKSPSDALDGSVLGQNIINTSAIPTSWVRVGAVPTSESKDVQIGMQAYLPGAAMVKVEKLLGNSVAWNQLCARIESRDNYGITWTSNEDGSITANGTATAMSSPGNVYTPQLINGHRYYVCGCPSGGSDSTYRMRFGSGAISETGDGLIFTSDGTQAALRPQVLTGTTVNNIVFRPQLFDLTLMFGESVANTMTVEMFEKLFPLSYYEYNPGEIISNEAAAVKGIGRNLWDERKFLEMGFTGGPGAYTRGVRNGFQIKNGVDFTFLPNMQYVIQTKGTRTGANPYCCFRYTDNTISAACGLGTVTNFIVSGAGKSIDSISFTYGSDPNRDNYTIQEFSICQAGPQDGTYEPYKESIAKLDAKKIYGKLNGTGNYIQVFPNDIRSAGTAYDEVDYQSRSAVVRADSVDLGNLSWTLSGSGYFESLNEVTDYKLPASNQAAFENQINAKGYSSTPASRLSNYDKAVAFWQSSKRIGIIDSAYSDAATFKTAMQGVELLYELATPKYYTDLKLSDDNGATFHDLPRPFYYTAGLEMKDPQDTASSVTAPARILASYKPLKK